MKTSNPLRIWPLTLFAFATLNSQLPISLSAAGITVNSLNDSGAGSLRQAIQTAANGDTIDTTIAGSSEPTGTPRVFRITEINTITGGTGRFANAKGSFIVDRLTDLNTGLTSGSFHGTITSPGSAH